MCIGRRGPVADALNCSRQSSAHLERQLCADNGPSRKIYVASLHCILAWRTSVSASRRRRPPGEGTWCRPRTVSRSGDRSRRGRDRGLAPHKVAGRPSPYRPPNPWRAHPPSPGHATRDSRIRFRRRRRAGRAGCGARSWRRSKPNERSCRPLHLGSVPADRSCRGRAAAATPHAAPNVPFSDHCQSQSLIPSGSNRACFAPTASCAADN